MRTKSFLIVGAVVVGALLFQNCGSFKALPGTNLNGQKIDLPSVGSSVPFPEPLPNLMNNCESNPNFNSCLLWKNPVAHQNTKLTPAYTQTMDISSWPKHGVTVSGFDSSGTLSNSTFSVLPGGKAATDAGQWVDITLLEKVSTTGGNFKFSQGSDTNFKLQQTSAFYWSHYQLEFMKRTSGKFWAEGKAIKIYTHNPDYSNGIFDANKNAVALGTKAGSAFAMQAEVIAHEMAHANVHWATNGAIWNSSGAPNADKPCPGVTGSVTCCPSKNGCAKAINEGQADYLAAVLFSSRPQFGETWANNTAGLKTPADNAFRDPRANKDLTADTAYNVVAMIGGAPKNLPGEARSMATLYTSIWWEIRNGAKSVPGGAVGEIDQLFTEHLQSLNGNETFISSRDKVLTFDTQLFAGKYGTLIKNEFARRGY